MKIFLSIDSSISEDLTMDLEQLANNQTKAGIIVERKFGEITKGEKSLDIATLSFVAASVSTFASVLAVWLQTRRRFSIDISDGKIILENPTEQDLLAVLSKDPELTDSHKLKLVLNAMVDE